jgi:hypothetical protein
MPNSNDDTPMTKQMQNKKPRMYIRGSARIAIRH